MKGTTLAILALLTSLVAYSMFSTAPVDPTRQLYEQWKQQTGWGFRASPADDEYRYKIFSQNIKEINQHNAKPDQTYTMGVNQFTGLSKQEFEETYLTHYEPNPTIDSDKAEHPIVNLFVDWVSYGAVSPVKNEGQCLANYAFSAVGALEGISVIFFKTQQEYSAQELIDCSGSFGNNGCNGGTMVNSFAFVGKRGINTEATYPYYGRAQSCRTSSGLFRIKNSVSGSNCASMETALTYQPVSVAVDGHNMVNYRGGIFSSCGTQLSVAALLVGATDSTYTLKFSWGVGWGEFGYIRLARMGNVCGVCSSYSYPSA